MVRKRRDIFQFIIGIGILVLLNVLGSFKFFRIDLTAENRYSLSDATVDLIESVDEVLYVRIYLEGDFPAGFQRLQRETKQMLDEFRAYNKNIQYEFINPDASEDAKVNKEVKQQLQFKGLKPYQLQVNEKGGSRSVDVYPGAILSYGEKEAPVALLLDQIAVSPEAQVNNSIQNLEFALANGIKSLVLKTKPTIAFLYGHGELEPNYIADFARTLSLNYTIDRFNIREFKSKDSTAENISIQAQQRSLNSYDAVIVAKPQNSFTDLDKYLLDQYIMNGGKMIWLLDAVHAEMDSLTKSSQFMAYPLMDRLRLSDMLFKYGVRINTNLIQDVISAGVSDQRSINKWVYFPLVMPQVDHPIAKNLNAIQMQFASSIDTVIAKGVTKTILLKSSPYSSTAGAPHIVSLAKLYQEQNPALYPQKNIPMAVLLEGNFQSAFKNRILPRQNGREQLTLKEDGDYSQMLVVSDGDIIRNQLNIVNPNMPKGTPLPLGLDQFTGQQYGNKEFLMNAIDYMLDETGLISIRSRELKMRLLNPARVKSESLFWSVLNTVLPIVMVICFGVVLMILRKRKFAKND